MSAVPETSVCAYPWQQMIIDLTGEVVPCCFWSGYGNGGKPLGNTNAGTLDEIWNGPAWQELRRSNATGEVAGTPCHQCVAWRWGGGRYPGFSWPAAFAPETGRCWLATIPEGFRQAVAERASGVAKTAGAAAAGPGGTGSAEPVLLCEDDVPLPLPDAAHDDIRALGGGRYSVWGPSLYFSTSDGSDPVTSGRRYELRCGPLRAPLAGLDKSAPSGRNLLAAYEEYRAGRTVVESRPSMLSFISTADCNIDCPACSQNTVRLARVQHRAETEPDVLAHVPYLHQFIWHGGEPYLIRGFRAFIDGFRTADNPNLTFGFTSNGTLLDAAELAKLDRFPRINASISIDSFVPETFAAIRAGARYDVVLANALRAAATYDAPRRVFSVGMIVGKSNLLELPHSLRFAFAHDLGLNLSPVVVYPVTERLDVFTDFAAQARGWTAALAEARQVLQEARARHATALERVNPEGMLDVLDGIVAAAAAHHARTFALRVHVSDPHGALAQMRRPGLIVARDGVPEHPLGYAELRGEGEHVLQLPRGELGHGARIGWYLVHDLLEPMGVVDMDSFRDSTLINVDDGGWREFPSALHLRVPPFTRVARPRNIALSHGGRATPDGLHPLSPDAILQHYRELVVREAASGRGALGEGEDEAKGERGPGTGAAGSGAPGAPGAGGDASRAPAPALGDLERRIRDRAALERRDRYGAFVALAAEGGSG